ncbi:MAG: group II intron reverse transcriptase/maturase [Deltaproteobacteria bacterium]|nr:group II intron reverse transcriptase/maturase [Deltaproteobacteria bacterium]
MLTTPERIRTLQRKLYRKAKQEPAFRFYALYDKVCRADILSHAYNLVRSKRGSAGVDGITFEDIEADEGLSAYLAELEEALKSKTYKPGPVKRVMIPKDDGSERPLGIPNIRDRVVQMAVKMVIEPIFETDFCGSSYGFRPKKSAHDAIDDIAYTLNKGYTKVIDADLSKYFDTIPHDKLLIVVAERISDGEILRLIKMWLKAPVAEEGRDGKIRYVGGGKRSRKGTPQGGVISPLLSNLYLHLLDRTWERQHVEKRLGARLVRYADDLVVLCKDGTQRPLEVVIRILERLELTLNENKTGVVDTHQESFDFLGFEMRMRKSWRTGNIYPHVQPSKKSLKKAKDRITVLTHRRMTPLPMDILMDQVNTSLRGWTGYFHHLHCGKVFAQLKEHVHQRLCTHLRRRHKIRDREGGFIRFPRRVLYEKYGLYKVPIKAGWTNAHALR